VHRWRFFGDFLLPAFSASRVHHVLDLHSKFANLTAEIRRGEKERKKEETRGQKYNGLEQTTGQKYNVRIC